MLFNSLPFLLFFVITTSAYFILPYRLRWALLLSASCYFYIIFVPIYILILLFTIVVDYAAGLCIERAQGKGRRLFLIASICANVGMLAFFKYYGFLEANFSAMASRFDMPLVLPVLNIILPIGLSFHTFQAMSYTIEVYRGNQKAERHFGIYALYVMFYPQLVAGPIERPQNLLHQFYEKHDWNWERVSRGLGLMAWGFFKKIVVADRLAFFVNPVFSDPSSHGSLTLWVALNFFAFQIYCDFSGYSDIAIGAARVLGFNLMDNFKTPYFSKSISEFWSRWHISLSTWFRDYVFIPLGGSRVAKVRVLFNAAIVFLISGLWHGANWTYVIWGALNGFYWMTEWWLSSSKKPRKQTAGSTPFLRSFGGWFVTYHAILLSWVFFRSDSLGQSMVFFQGLIHFWNFPAASEFSHFLNNTPSVSFFDLGVSLFALGLLLAQELRLPAKVWEALRLRPEFGPSFGFALLISVLLLLGIFEDGSRFIYFQF